MKRIFKAIFKGFWMLGAPIRRPIVRRIDGRLAALISDTANARMMPPIMDVLGQSGQRLDRIEQALGRAERAAANLGDELDLVLNGLSREIFRLQAQVESLQQALADEHRTLGSRLSIVDESGEGSPLLRSPAPGERSKVG